MFLKTNYSLTDFLGKQDRIASIIMQNLEEFEKNMGVKISNLSVFKIDVPRKYRASTKIAKQNIKAEVDSEQILKMVDSNLNKMQEDMNVVFSGEQGNAKNISKEQTQNSFNSQNSFHKAKTNDDIFIFNEHNDINFHNNENQTYSNFEQQAPNIIFGESDEKKQEDKKQEIPTDLNSPNEKTSLKEKSNLTAKEKDIQKADESKGKPEKAKDSFKICACCGAKNPANAEYCSVCKSKL